MVQYLECRCRGDPLSGVNRGVDPVSLATGFRLADLNVPYYNSRPNEGQLFERADSTIDLHKMDWPHNIHCA